MKYVIVVVLWILIWGAAGYFTVRAIQMREESKRRAAAIADWYMRQQAIQRKANAGRNGDIVISLNPFDDLLKKDDLA